MKKAVLAMLIICVAPGAEKQYESGKVGEIVKQPHSDYGSGNKAVLYTIATPDRSVVAADVSGTAFSNYRAEKFRVGEDVQFRTHKDRCFVVFQGKEAKMWLDSEKAVARK